MNFREHVHAADVHYVVSLIGLLRCYKETRSPPLHHMKCVHEEALVSSKCINFQTAFV